MESDIAKDSAPSSDPFQIPGGLLPPNEESIPLLTDIFLENVRIQRELILDHASEQVVV